MHGYGFAHEGEVSGSCPQIILDITHVVYKQSVWTLAAMQDMIYVSTLDMKILKEHSVEGMDVHTTKSTIALHACNRFSDVSR